MNIRDLVHKENDWTLFLDRDGVLNKRPGNGYVRNPNEFKWLPGSLEAMAYFKRIFNRMIVVTNQQGVGKALMDAEQLALIHDKMIQDTLKAGGRIDAIYHATGLRYDDSFNRKPAEGMFLKTIKDFPSITPNKSIMVGDSFTDLLFGKRLGMHTVFISQTTLKPINYHFLKDYQFNDLKAFAEFLTRQELNISWDL